MEKRTAWVICAGVCVLLGLSAAGCARTTEEESTPWAIDRGAGVAPEVNPLGVQGDILVAGSSTVFPLSEAIAARFIDEGYGGNVSIQSIGTGGGFERYCSTGETDISNASRPIKESEREACRAIGRDPVEFNIAVDALAIVVHAENTWLREASIDRLREIFTAELWSDVDPAWPNESILRFVPGTDSGTFDFFVEEVFAHEAEPLLLSENLQLSEDDNVLLRGVAGSRNAIGFFGYAYFINNSDKINAVAIEGVEIGEESVLGNTYPLSRPLLLYSDAEIMRSRPQVGAFLAYTLAVVGEEAGRVGYFPASDAELEAGNTLWVDIMQGAY